MLSRGSSLFSHDQLQGNLHRFQVKIRFLEQPERNLHLDPSPSWVSLPLALSRVIKISKKERVDNVEDERESIWTLLKLSCRYLAGPCWVGWGGGKAVWGVPTREGR